MKSKLISTRTGAAVFSLFFCSAIQAQSLSKLEVAAGDVFYVDAGNQLAVDTLVLKDNATVQFASTAPGKLHAKVAYVGNGCIISAKGKDGANGKDGLRGSRHGRTGSQKSLASTAGQGEDGKSGENGGHGGNLELSIYFSTLGTLTIDTQGGKGGNGGNGGDGARGTQDKVETVVTTNKGHSQTYTTTVPGQPSGDGGNAGEGGRAGNGGNVELTYSTADFIPIFNHGAVKHGINILPYAGKDGMHGKPGRGGINATDGRQLYNAESSAVDGSVKLINAKPQQ